MQATMINTVSPRATRSHPWELWVEPRHERRAMYCGVVVEVVERFSLCALVRRPDGYSCIVDAADLEVR